MFDFNDCSGIWNTSVKVKSPTVGDLCGAFSVKPTQVFAHSTSLHYLRNNIVLLLFHGHAFSQSAPVQSIILVTKERFFVGPTKVVTSNLPNFSMLGMELPDSANSVLGHLRIKDKRNVKTATSVNRWEIYYGGAVSIMFNSLNSKETEIENSSLARIEYFFSIPYTGTLPLSVAPSAE